jgi:crossover junction endodeoxyribonuclease RuvC
MVHIGIDPGKGGGICFIKNKDIAVAYKCPETIEQMTSILKKEIKGFRKKQATIENVHSMPRDGVVSAFSFGRNFGTWLGILTALNIDFNMVSPQKWMKTFHPLPKEKKSRKHKLKQIAFDLHPDAKNTLSTADAVLIAHYGLTLK